jgi:voltage-gated potassium channel
VHRHQRRALATIAAAAILDVSLGVAFAVTDHVSAADGLYWATTTATTVGYGDIAPKGWLPHALAVAVMLTVIPLFAATFSLLTSGLTAGHVVGAEERIKRHVNGALRHHLAKPGGPHDQEG